MQNQIKKNLTLKKKFTPRNSKRKLFFSKQLKRALLNTFQEAKSFKTFVDPELLLYGLLTQSNGLASRLLCKTISNFRNSKITATNISNKIREVNKEKYQTNSILTTLSEFSPEFRNENEKTPWLGSEVKMILKTSIISSLKVKNKANIISTKHLFFELLNSESIRILLRKISN